MKLTPPCRYKVTFFERQYSKMRRNIVPHAYYLDESERMASLINGTSRPATSLTPRSTAENDKMATAAATSVVAATAPNAI